MAKSTQEIYNDIIAHIKKEGSALKTWYAGVTYDIETRLFDAHRVSEEDDWFIYRQASSAQAARDVEAALLEAGIDGGTGGGDDSCTYVYCYKKTSITKP